MVYDKVEAAFPSKEGTVTLDCRQHRAAILKLAEELVAEEREGCAVELERAFCNGKETPLLVNVCKAATDIIRARK